jgi:hypothetical protein
MVYVPAGNVAQANLRYTWDGQQVENTLYFELGGSFWDTNLLEILGADLASWWQNNMAASLSSTLTLREVYCVDLSSQTGPTGTFVPNPLPSGADITASAPNNVSFAVSFRTAGRGRSSRGRNYVPGLTEQHIEDNEVIPTMVTFLTDAYSELLSQSTFTSTISWVVVSRYANKQPRTQALVQPVTAVLATDSVVDSQRKRLPKRGR